MSLNAISCACSDAARGLRVELELLAALVGAVAVAHRHRPDAPRDATEHRVLGVHAVGEEERQVRREVVDVHAAREVGLDEGEAVGERERELRDRVRAGLGDVIARDRHRVEVRTLCCDEVFLDVAHHLQREFGGEDAGVLALVFLEDVGLHGAAHRRERPRVDLRASSSVGSRPFSSLNFVDLLVDRGVEEHREDRRRRAVDRHRDRGGRRAQVEARVEHLHVVERRDRHARIADLAVDVRARVGMRFISPSLPCWR